MNFLQDILPPRARKVAYGTLAAATAVQTAVHVIPDGAWGKILTAAAALGFTVAAGNTGTTPTVPPTAG